jgi:hypothetical protein
LPALGHTLVVIGQEPVTDEGYVRDMGGRAPAGLMDYVHLEYSPAVFATSLKVIQAEMDKYPGSAVQLGVTMGNSTFWSTVGGDPQPPGALEVLSGTYDANISTLAAWLKQLNHVTYLRIGYEFDLLGGQWGTPDEYAAAYRYIVDHLRRAGVTNALYVWHSAGAYFRALDYSGLVGLIGSADRTPNHSLDPLLPLLAKTLKTGGDLAGNGGDLQPISDYYPGPGYVDLFAISYWDDVYGLGPTSDKNRALYRQREQEILDQAKAMGLPLMVAESTPAYIGFNHGAKSLQWLQRYFGLIERNDIRVASLIVADWRHIDNGFWGQAYWNGFWPDAQVAHYADTRAYWIRKLSQPRYAN